VTGGTRLAGIDRDLEPAIWMVVGALCFASMGAMTHALGDRCDWLVVGLVRAAFMCGTAVLLARLAGVRLVFWTPRTLWVRSLAGSFSLVCNFYALARLPVADALTLSHTYPLWIVLLTALALREPPSPPEWLGVLCGVAGIVLIERPHLAGDRLASVVALVSAVATAVAMLGLNRLRSVGALAVMAHFAGVATLVAAAGVLSRPGVLLGFVPDSGTLALLFGVAVSGTAGQYCLTRAYTAGKPARLAVVGLTQVVFALGFDLALWGRRLDATVGLGFLLVLAPSAWLAGQTSARLASLSRAKGEPRSTDTPTTERVEDLGASVAAPEEVL
jgi:drug/metabolite transporter (DMT)-like permease